ncbi:hypothetical protein HDU98_006232 [Podochytrium sp. JEL0797]|nr:hypothetical protein HDU98_006232 [Podochytrium sp. JEL0797]
MRRAPHIEDLTIQLEAFVKYPKEHKTSPPTAPFVLLSKTTTLVHNNKHAAAHGPPTTIVSAPSVNSSPHLRTIDFPFSFPITPSELAHLPPSIQLSPWGPYNGSPFGLKYCLRVVCNFAIDSLMPDDLSLRSGGSGSGSSGGFFDASSTPSVQHVTDTRVITWPYFKESNLLAVMKNDILESWAELNGRDAIASMDSKSVEAVKQLIGRGHGNPIRRLGRCSLVDYAPVGSGKKVVVVGSGGWQGAVEFESDTICYGDRRQIKFQILEPEYYRAMKNGRELDTAGEPQIDTLVGDALKIRRGMAHFELILVESWNWLGLAEKNGSREIALLEVTETTIEEFGEEQLAYIKFSDFLLPSIRIPNVQVSHKLVFRFRIPQSPIRPASRIPEFDPAGIILNNLPKTEIKSTPASAVKALANDANSFSDIEQIITSAHIQVAAFSRNEADLLFTGATNLPQTILDLLPPGFITHNRDLYMRSPSIAKDLSLHSPSSNVDRTDNHKRGSKSTLSSSSSSTHSSSSKSKFHVLFASTPLLSTPTAASSSRDTIATPANTFKSTNLGRTPSLTRTISTNRRFGLLTQKSSQKNSATPTPSPAPAATPRRSMDLLNMASSSLSLRGAAAGAAPLPPPPPLPAVPSMSLRGQNSVVESLVATRRSASVTSATASTSSTDRGGGGKLVSTMDLALCNNLSKSGFL